MLREEEAVALLESHSVSVRIIELVSIKVQSLPVLSIAIPRVLVIRRKPGRMR